MQCLIQCRGSPTFMNKRITLNINLIEFFTKRKGMTLLYCLTHTILVTSGRGYMNKKQFLEAWSKSSGKSIKTLYRIFKKLEKLGFWRQQNHMVYMVGKKRALLNLDQKLCRLHIKFDQEHYSNFISFRKHCIVQTGLYYQSKFKKAHRFILKNTNCPLITQGIEFPISSDKEKVGIASRYLSKKIGLSRSTVRNSLKGSTRLNYENVRIISATELDYLKNQSFFTENPRYKVTFTKKGIMLRYQLPSTIVTEPLFGRDNKLIRTNPLNSRLMANRSKGIITSVIMG